MTQTATNARVEYTGNNSTTAFAMTFPITAAGDVSVYVDGVLKTITTHYTVAVTSYPGTGTITFGTAPGTSTAVLLLQNVPLTQPVDYVAFGAFTAATNETALDRNTMHSIRRNDKLNTTFGVSDTMKVSDRPTMTLTEVAADRASMVLGFNAAGTALTALTEIGEYQGNWAASTAYVVRDLVKDTSNNNIYICITAHTSSGSQPISSNTDSAKWTLIVDAASATTSATAAATSATASAASATTATAQAVISTAKAVIATAKAVLTASDATDTAADLVETAADVVLAEAAKVSAVASVGALAFKFTFDSSTTMADPGAGDVRFNHGTVGSVSAIAFDATSADTSNPDVSDFIANWSSGTNSAHEGYITIRKSGTPATFAVFSLTGAVVDNTGWLQCPVTFVDSNGTWSNADVMYISFAKSGNLGATGTLSVGSVTPSTVSVGGSATASVTNVGSSTAGTFNFAFGIPTGATGARGSDAGLDMTFESTTTDSDQGVGKVWFNNGTLASASVLYMDDVDRNSASINAYVDSWDDSTTTALRGTVKVTKQSDPAVFAFYSVTGAVTSASTYSKVAVTYVTGAGSFTDADVSSVNFVRTGNTGSAGSSTPSDATFRIQDNSDATKQIAFEASTISSGTTRTVTMPDEDVTLGEGGVVTTAGDTFSNYNAISGNVTTTTTTTENMFLMGQISVTGTAVWTIAGNGVLQII
jgi:hypothetical protein